MVPKAFTPQDEITLLINSLHELNVLDHVNIETGRALRSGSKLLPGVLLHFFQAVKAGYRQVPPGAQGSQGAPYELHINVNVIQFPSI